MNILSVSPQESQQNVSKVLIGGDCGYFQIVTGTTEQQIVTTSAQTVDALKCVNSNM